jgi:hypothetical protein
MEMQQETNPEVTAASGAPGTCSCGNTPAGASLPAPITPSYIYAIGKIEARFPNESIEKEFAQIAARSDAAGMTDQKLLRSVMTLRENRYLARNMCWVFSVQGLPTYILVSRDPADVELLIQALREKPTPGDLDAVIGVRGPLSRPQMCNGLSLPIVLFDQIYSFDRSTLEKAVPKPSNTDAAGFQAVVSEVVERILQLADNAGGTDEHRALNYLVLRYPAIYAAAAAAQQRNASLAGVDVRASGLSGVRKVMDVIFSFRDRATDVIDKQMVRVDVTDQFLFLVSKLSPYYDR